MKDVSLSDIVNENIPRKEAVKKVVCRYIEHDAPVPVSLIIEYNKTREN